MPMILNCAARVRTTFATAILLIGAPVCAAERPAAYDVAPTTAAPAQVLTTTGTIVPLLSEPERRKLGIRSGPDSIAEDWTDSSGKTWILFSGALTAGGRGTFRVPVDPDLTHVTGTTLEVVLQPVRSGVGDDERGAGLPAATRPVSDAARGAFDLDYAGGGSLLTCPGPKARRYYVYHGENHTDPDGQLHLGPKAGWTGIGLAEWNESGRRFERVGQIVGMGTSNQWKKGSDGWLTAQAPPLSGNPAVIVNPKDGYAYLYYTDVTDDPNYASLELKCDTRPCVAVARTRADALCDAPAGQPVKWQKYRHGAFDQDALLEPAAATARGKGTGGGFTPLFQRENRAPELLPTVNYLPAHGVFVMVSVGEGRRFFTRYSADGLRWSESSELVGPPQAGQVQAYPRLHVLGSGASEHYVLTFTRKSDERWKFAELARVAVEFGQNVSH